MIVDEHLPCGTLGDYDSATNTIRLDPRQSATQYLCTLMHEWEHWRADHTPTGDLHADAVMETEASQRAARRLVDLHDLAEVAAAHAGDIHRMADELGVDVDTLAVRVKHLHPSERHYLRRRLAHLEETA